MTDWQAQAKFARWRAERARERMFSEFRMNIYYAIAFSWFITWPAHKTPDLGPWLMPVWLGAMLGPIAIGVVWSALLHFQEWRAGKRI